MVPGASNTSGKDPLRVAFRGVQPEYREVDSPILNLLSRASGRQIQPVSTFSSSPEVIFSSSHNATRRRVTAAVGTRLYGAASSLRVLPEQRRPTLHSVRPFRLWYSGEAERPPPGQWDLTLSSEVDEMEGRNVYLPVWFDTVGLLGQPTVRFTDGPVGPEIFAQPRPVLEHDRPGFVCAFVGRWTRERQVAVEMLSEIGRVDVFGPAVGRPVPTKNEVGSKYRFVLCFENALLPGYVTEKPFDAWQLGAIPLWRGSDTAEFLNPRALVNAANFSTLRDFVDFVRELEADDSRRVTMLSEPLLTKCPSLESLVEKVGGALSTGRRHHTGRSLAERRTRRRP